MPARDWAQKIVDAWLYGEDVQAAIARVPAWQRDLATEMARSTCGLIQSWHRKVQDGYHLYRVPRGFRASVEQVMVRDRV